MNAVTRFFSAVAMVATVVAPTVASARPVRPSTNVISAAVAAPALVAQRAATPTKKSSEVFGLAALPIFIGALAVVSLIVVVATDDDEPSSPA